MLVEDTLRTCAEYLTVSKRKYLVEHRAQTYHSLVLREKLQTALRWIMVRDTGGVFHPGDRCNKMGDRVM